jgi:hypothetical protein
VGEFIENACPFVGILNEENSYKGVECFMGGTGRLNEIGEDLYRRGEVQQALRAFEEAVKVLPSSARAHSNLATVYWSLNDHARAIEHIEQAYAIEPENKRVLLNCIEINAAVSHQDRALSIGQQYLLKYPGDSEVISLVERLSGKTYDYKQTMTQSLESTPAGPYIERKVSDRSSLINYCIERFAYEKYLEIGCHENETFDQIRIPYKVGIDPVKGGTIRLTSDEFFRLSDDTFDIVFIDGLHYCEQVYKDVRSSLLRLRKNGLIILHDCSPQQEIHQLRDPVVYTWHGDVWKAFTLFRQDPNLDCVVGDFDGGLGLIRPRENPAPLAVEKPYPELSWQDLVQNRETYLRPHDAEKVKRWL